MQAVNRGEANGSSKEVSGVTSAGPGDGWGGGSG